MAEHKILVVDDDPDIREVVSILLADEGYRPIQAENGGAAVEKVYADKDIDLVIMDIMMPGVNGIEACEMIRRKSKVPVLFLTAKSQEEDKVNAYTGGGDDYLVKPFSQTELVMKVRSLLRRYTEYRKAVRGTADQEAINDKVSLDSRRRCAVKEGKLVPLTEKEYKIMRYFFDHRGEIISNKNIYEGVWNKNYTAADSNTVMVHILNLRRKLEDDASRPELIQTIWGKGYTIE